MEKRARHPSRYKKQSLVHDELAQRVWRFDMADLAKSALQKFGQSQDLALHGESASSERRLEDSGFDFAKTMKNRLGIVGRAQMALEERRIAREEVKEVLRGQMRAQTQLMLSRARLDLEYLKGIDQAAHNVRIQRIEIFLLQEEGRLQHQLNGMIDSFEDEYTSQYSGVQKKLGDELESGKITPEIFDLRMRRADKRYQDSMDKSANDVQLIIDNHRGNLLKALTNEL
jgi:hypothetical protein